MNTIKEYNEQLFFHPFYTFFLHRGKTRFFKKITNFFKNTLFLKSRIFQKSHFFSKIRYFKITVFSPKNDVIGENHTL